MSKKIFKVFTLLYLAFSLGGFSWELAQSSGNPSPTPPYPTPSPVGPMPTPTNTPFFPVNEPPPLPFTSLTLEILAPTQTVLLLQPIALVVALTNTNSRPALGYKTLEFGNSPISLDVKRVGTSERIPIEQLDPILRLSNKHHAPLQPRESVRSNNLLTLSLNRYFPEPGTYEIRAKLASSDRTEFIESEPVTLIVREPGIADQAAYNLIRNSAFGEYLFSGAEFRRVERTLETLTAFYPQSPYARHANFVLGEVYFHRRDNLRALANLVRLENNNDFIFADKVREYLAEIRRINASQPGTEKPEPKKP